MSLGYWLFKSEPDVFGIDDLEARGERGECWDGVRNYQARNWLRDAVAVGDEVLFYHSSCARVGVAGVAEVIRAGYPDPTQFDPESPYWDPRAETRAPRWYAVDVRFRRRFPQVLTLAQLKRLPELAQSPLVRRGNRLSIMPVSAAQWRAILRAVPET